MILRRARTRPRTTAPDDAHRHALIHGPQTTALDPSALDAAGVAANTLAKAVVAVAPARPVTDGSDAGVFFGEGVGETTDGAATVPPRTGRRSVGAVGPAMSGGAGHGPLGGVRGAPGITYPRSVLERRTDAVASTARGGLA